MKHYYHFTANKLRDGRPIPPIGEWLEHHGELSICQSGLHASPCPWWAYVHAPGTMLHLVELGGTVLTDRFLGDIVCASRRRIIASFDAAGLFRDFARYCAREVAHFWDPPKTVRRWLDTGDTKHLAAVTRYAQRMTRGKETSRTDVKLAARGAESASAHAMLAALASAKPETQILAAPSHAAWHAVMAEVSAGAGEYHAFFHKFCGVFNEMADKALRAPINLSEQMERA